MMKGEMEETSPTHNHFVKRVMLVSGQRLGQYICPVVICIYLDPLNDPLPNLILKMMPFKCNVFSPRFSCITVGKDYARFIIFINSGS